VEAGAATADIRKSRRAHVAAAAGQSGNDAIEESGRRAATKSGVNPVPRAAPQTGSGIPTASGGEKVEARRGENEEQR